MNKKNNQKEKDSGRRTTIYFTQQEYKALEKLKPHPLVKMSVFLKNLIKDTTKI